MPIRSKLASALAGAARRPPVLAKPVRVIYERNCSVGRTVAILSDSWVFLVLRESYFAATSS